MTAPLADNTGSWGAIQVCLCDLTRPRGLVRLTGRELVGRAVKTLAHGELTPLGEDGGAIELEVLAAVEVTFLIGVIVTEAWIAANFCSDFALLNFAIARSRRRNG